MIRIGLIHPPLHNIVREFTPPLGLAYIASYLRKHGYDCEIIDANACRKDVVTLAEEVAGRFDIIGITVVTIAVPVVGELVRRIKARDPDVKIVLGGIHPTVAHEHLLRAYPDIDVIVIGEGETAFLELVKSREENDEFFKDREKLKAIDGIAFFSDAESGEVIRTKERELISDIDTVPFPLFEKLPMARYAAPASRSIGTPPGKTGFMITARGCFTKCTFCASPTMWRRCRVRTAESVIEEIKFLSRTYGIKQIDFQDDTLTAIPARLEKICDFLIDNNMGIEWNGFAKVTDIKDRKLLEKMRRAGCYELQFGIESADQHILDLANKRIKVEDSARAVRLCNDAGIRTLGYFIIGLPGETKDTAHKTIDFARELDLDLAAFYILLPYPGTPIYNDLVSRGRIRDFFAGEVAENYSVFKDPVISACDLTIDELKQLRIQALKQFYFSKRFVIKTIKSVLKSPRNIFPLLQILKEFYGFALDVVRFR
jgi:radical SAM superfamily enzyme YgiQ (UPF0313 family)